MNKSLIRNNTNYYTLYGNHIQAGYKKGADFNWPDVAACMQLCTIQVWFPRKTPAHQFGNISGIKCE